MRLFKKNDTQKNNKKLPMTGRVKKGFRFYCMVVMAMTVVLGSSVTAFAAGDPLTVVNNLSDFIFGLVRAVGMIMLGFGIVQIGLSLKSHDPSQRANGFLTLVIVMSISVCSGTPRPVKKQRAMKGGDLIHYRLKISDCFRFRNNPQRE